MIQRGWWECIWIGSGQVVALNSPSKSLSVAPVVRYQAALQGTLICTIEKRGKTLIQRSLRPAKKLQNGLLNSLLTPCRALSDVS